MTYSTELIRDGLPTPLMETPSQKANIEAWIADSGVSLSYQTVAKKLKQYKSGRGTYNLEVTKETVKDLEVSYNSPAIPSTEQNLIPEKDDSFVKFGNFTDIKKIISSRLFYPTFITGHWGNGKAFSVEQACAQLGRELIRVNVIETDEDDLVGGFKDLLMGILHGTMVHVIEALERGAVSFWTRSTWHPTKSSVFGPF